MAHQVIITGVPSTGGTRPTPYPRRSIHDLVTDTRQFSLYVQAIDAMMKAPATDPLSWYQVSGIHGLPTTPWDNASPTKSRNGYCVHATPHFPTWHRPYVLLFEQALVTQAIRISQRYTGQDAAAWQAAATSLRAPYWDWAVNALPPNQVISMATLTVDGPQGKVTLNPNPLLGYRYKAGDPRIDSRSKTVRCPSRLNPNESDIRALTASLRVLDNPNDPMRDRVWTTLTDASTWNLFSNKATAQGRFRNSLESVHDDIHVLVGGNGQMSDPGLAAFDPIFWLHHTNVDRLLSLWQALHPSGSQTWTADNPRFVPFWNGQTTFFDSNGIRPWSTLNYTYPEFAQVGPGTDPRTVQMAVLAEVRNLYLDEEDDTEDEVFAQAKATARTTVAKAPAPAAAAAPAPAAPAPAAAAPAAAPKQVVMAASPPAPGTQAVPPASAVHASPPAPGTQAKPPASATHASPPAPGHQAKPPASAMHGHGSPPAPGHHATPPAMAMHGVQKPQAAAHSVDTDQFPISITHQPGAAGKHLDWFVRIRIPIGAIDQSVTVLFFFGPAPKEEHDWREAENLVGTHAQFINSKPEDCDNCQTNRENRVVSEGVVRLTRALRRHNLYGKPTADIDKYLHDKLEWRLQKTDATIVDPSTVEGLEVAVMTVPLEFDRHGWGWSKREDVRPHHEEVTKHRPGGRHHAPAGHH